MWNTKALECQILLDVDCSATTYNSPISPLVQAALDKTKEGILNKPTPDPTSVVDALFSGQDLSSAPKPKAKAKNNTIPIDRTETKEESLSGSLLKYVNSTDATKASLEEAFCRDIDAFNEAFQVEDGRPSKCKEVPKAACAMLHDSGTCSGGWTLEVLPGTQRRLKYFSSDWKYRNDIDTIGLRSGCTFLGFTGSSFDGNKMVLTAGVTDRWLVLTNDEAYSHFHEDIESFQCLCRG